MKRPTKKPQKQSLGGEVVGVVLIAFGLICALSVFFMIEMPLIHGLRLLLFGVFGVAGYVTPILLIFFGFFAIAARHSNIKTARLVMFFIALVAVLGGIHLATMPATDLGFFEFTQFSYRFGADYHLGTGALGAIISYLSYSFIGTVGGIIIFAALFLISIMVMTRMSLKKAGEDVAKAARDTAGVIADKAQKLGQKHNANNFIDDVSVYEENDYAPDYEQPYQEHYEPVHEHRFGIGKWDFIIEERKKGEAATSYLDMNDYPEYVPVSHEPMPEPIKKRETKPRAKKSEVIPIGSYVPPPVDLLSPGRPASNKSVKEELRQKSELLESTLKSFGITARVMDVSRGPVVTRFELQPAPGVKVSRIVGLSDDIALNMAARRVRIEAPIPGKAAIGIEIPNAETSMVCARDLIDSDEFRGLKSDITFALGQDIAGQNVYADLAKMPHLLIAGATGSGKSVCVNTLIMSMLYHAGPENLQLIMIDPKQVELSAYNGIPHLRVPVITEPKKAAGALNWVVAEMTRRYREFAQLGTKDLERFNNLARKNGTEKYPKLVVVIDELADLMMTAQNEVEDAICRIAQLGRASGIHLLVATQRPSVDVITGLIKANIPSRIAFATSSQVDSRTILDMAGAEKLLGNGDMLYSPTGSAKPMRIQGCYITDTEVDKITDYLKQFGSAEYDSECQQAVENAELDKRGRLISTPVTATENAVGGDELLSAALRAALENDGVSASYLQRKLKVGYARAARLLDEMEERNYIGPSEGAKPRSCLITWAEYRNLFSSGE